MTNLQAIDLLKGLEQSLDDYCELNDEGKTAFRMAIAALELFGNSEQLPSAQPDRAIIDDCLHHIYKNISVHTATGGVIAIRYYMEKLYEEIYGEGEKPWWMT